MAMNPDTNKLEMLAFNEELKRQLDEAGGPPMTVGDMMSKIAEFNRSQLVRPDGTPVPDHWAIYTVGETIVLKGYTFRVAYMNESGMLLEPVGPEVVEDVPG